jgi:hypothetical protein
MLSLAYDIPVNTLTRLTFPAKAMEIGSKADISIAHLTDRGGDPNLNIDRKKYP